MRIAVIITLAISAAVLTGCGKTTEEYRTYDYTSNECSTGTVKYKTEAEFCQKIVDDKLNNYCAAGLRYEEYKKRCAPAAQSDSQARPAPISNPKPRTQASCFKPETITPLGTEISLNEFIDNVDGQYEIVSLTGMAEYRGGSDETSISVNASVDADKVDGFFSCKNFANDPQESFKGFFLMPKVIQRKDGSYQETVLSAYEVHGSQTNASDQLENFIRVEKSWLKKMTGNDDELRFYRINPTTFRMVNRGQKVKGNEVWELLITGVYTLKNKPAVLPQPQSDTDRSKIDKICKSYYSTSDQVACLLKVKNLQVADDLISICSEHYSTSDKVHCLIKLDRVEVPKNVIETCRQYYSTSDKVNCILKFKAD